MSKARGRCVSVCACAQLIAVQWFMVGVPPFVRLSNLETSLNAKGTHLQWTEAAFSSKTILSLRVDEI